MIPINIAHLMELLKEYSDWSRDEAKFLGLWNLAPRDGWNRDGSMDIEYMVWWLQEELREGDNVY